MFFLFYLFLVKNKVSLQVTKRSFVSFCFVMLQHFPAVKMTVAILFEIAGLWWRFPVETKINTNLKCGSFNDFSVKLVHLSFEIHNDIKKTLRLNQKSKRFIYTRQMKPIYCFCFISILKSSRWQFISV